MRHATEILQGTGILRFMGYRLAKSGRPRRNLPGEVLTSVKELVTGTRVKHYALQDWLKMYDEFGQVLRLESLIYNVRAYKVFRTREGDPDGKMSYLRLRNGVADIHRRAEIGHKVNDRYAEALATVEDKTPLAELTKDLGKPTTWKGRSARALNPLAPNDVALLEAIACGDFIINGFRNRDLRALLFPNSSEAAPQEAKRQASKVTRLIRLLRARIDRQSAQDASLSSRPRRSQTSDRPLDRP